MDVRQNVLKYARLHQMLFEKRLGEGIDGVVLSTNRQTAVKALRREEGYLRERNAYLRLREHNVGKLGEFNVPRLVNHDDELWIVEMEIVHPPYVLDFASSYVDTKPPYSRSEQARFDREFQERFEPEDWPKVRMIRSMLRGIGIELVDLKPGNVTLR